MVMLVRNYLWGLNNECDVSDKIRIRLTAYDSRVLDQSTTEIVDTAKRTGARLAGLSPTGTMPHAMVLIFGDTVRALEAFDRHVEDDVPRPLPDERDWDTEMAFAAPAIIDITGDLLTVLQLSAHDALRAYEPRANPLSETLKMPLHWAIASQTIAQELVPGSSTK